MLIPKLKGKTTYKILTIELLLLRHASFRYDLGGRSRNSFLVDLATGENDGILVSNSSRFGKLQSLHSVLHHAF